MLEVRDRLNFEDYLDSLLNSVESDDLEFKSAAGGFPGSFWDTYSAFANSEGGVIVLGVIERKGKFYIDNLSDEQIEKYTKDFWNNVNNRATVSCNLLKTEDVVVEDYNGHKLMLFFMKDNIRRDDPPAHIAVREALVNLCIHTDYSADATMVVRLFSNKMVFSNPGTLLVSKTQYYEESTSVCRNTTLQKMFMQIGSAEKAGSGVDKILAGWRFANWRAPMLRLLTQPDIVELTMMMESLMDDATKERLAQIFGPKITTIGQKRLLALNAACIDGYVTNESLRVVLDIHKAEIADLLKDMCQDGLLVQDGYGRGTKYYLPNGDSNIPSNIASSDSNITCSGSNIPSNIASSGSKVANLSSNISSLNISISNMESLRKKKKLSFEELKKLICLVCSDWQSLDELALQVNRNKTYLKIYVIPRMLADKSLEMMFPGVPKHPRQKYKSIVNK